MGKYSAIGECANTANTTIINLFGSAAVRPKIYDLIIGSDASAADNATEYNLQRTTAVGTEGSGFTPVPLDSLTVASTADAGVGVFGAEPTYTANAVLLEVALNQRATFRWVAAPDGQIILTAASGNGVGVRSITTSAAINVSVTLHFEE